MAIDADDFIVHISIKIIIDPGLLYAISSCMCVTLFFIFPEKKKERNKTFIFILKTFLLKWDAVATSTQ